MLNRKSEQDKWIDADTLKLQIVNSFYEIYEGVKPPHQKQTDNHERATNHQVPSSQVVRVHTNDHQPGASKNGE
jgi:hypothetical protein